MDKHVLYALGDMQKGLDKKYAVYLNISYPRAFEVVTKVHEISMDFIKTELKINDTVNFNLSDWVYIKLLGNVDNDDDDNDTVYTFTSKLVKELRINICIVKNIL